MEEEIISFKTAKLAKEKGFKEPTVHVVQPDGRVLIWGGVGDFFVNGKSEYPSRKKPNCVSAPTQSLLQRWLREKYNIHISIWYNYLTDKWRIDYLHQFKSNDEYHDFDEEYNTYEQALEEGLYEALKLIP